MLFDSIFQLFFYNNKFWKPDNWCSFSTDSELWILYYEGEKINVNFGLDYKKGGHCVKCIWFSPSFQECLYKVATMPNQSDCLSRFIVIEPVENSELCGIVIKLFHGKIMLLWQKCALMFGLLNSLVNPIIYGFWYSQFRIRIVQTWKNFFFKSFKTFSYDQVCWIWLMYL